MKGLTFTFSVPLFLMLPFKDDLSDAKEQMEREQKDAAGNIGAYSSGYKLTIN